MDFYSHLKKGERWYKRNLQKPRSWLYLQLANSHTPWSLTAGTWSFQPMEKEIPNLETIIFRFHVRLQEGNCLSKSPYVTSFCISVKLSKISLPCSHTNLILQPFYGTRTQRNAQVLLLREMLIRFTCFSTKMGDLSKGLILTLELIGMRGLLKKTSLDTIPGVTLKEVDPDFLLERTFFTQ